MQNCRFRPTSQAYSHSFFKSAKLSIRLWVRVSLIISQLHNSHFIHSPQDAIDLRMSIALVRLFLSKAYYGFSTEDYRLRSLLNIWTLHSLIVRSGALQAIRWDLMDL